MEALNSLKAADIGSTGITEANEILDVTIREENERKKSLDKNKIKLIEDRIDEFSSFVESYRSRADESNVLELKLRIKSMFKLWDEDILKFKWNYVEEDNTGIQDIKKLLPKYFRVLAKAHLIVQKYNEKNTKGICTDESCDIIDSTKISN